MILNWSALREECPLTIQLIEKKTEFKYNPIYGTLLNTANDQLTYAHLEGFFDDHGWFMSVIPTDFPHWNGILSDTTGKILLNDPDQFAEVKSRNHCKSLLAGITIKFFEEQVKDMMKLPEEKTTVLTLEHVIESAWQKPLETLQVSDLTLDGRGLLSSSVCCVVQAKDGNAVVMKNPGKLPFIGMIIKM